MQIIQIILALSILVLIHELGHFAFARLFGIRVDKFYLFFDAGGFRLFSTRSKWFLKLFPKAAEWETEYGIGWLPLGGYCKICGMVDESMDTDFMGSEPKPWEFRSKPAWQRLLVMVGGVLFNFILGILIYSFILGKWGEGYYKAEGNSIYVREASLAEELGFQTGDQILYLDGQTTDNFHMMQIEIARNLVSTATVIRGNDTVDIHIDQKYIPQILNTPELFELAVPFTISGIAEGSPNAQADIRDGDKVTAIDTVQIRYVQDGLGVLTENAGGQVDVTLKRDSVTFSSTMAVSPEGNIGVMLQNPPVEIREYSFWSAIPAGCRKAYDMTIGQIKDLRLIAKPSTGAYKSVGSVIAMTEAMPKKWNWALFLNITAMLSIILGVMNLLPIPALDGGHMVFTIYEMITGRKPSDKFLYVMQLIGMLLIFGLMFLAFGNDIARLLR